MFVIDTDHGLGIIRKGTPVNNYSRAVDELTYADLDANRQEMLNLISVEEFLSQGRGGVHPQMYSRLFILNLYVVPKQLGNQLSVHKYVTFIASFLYKFV